MIYCTQMAKIRLSNGHEALVDDEDLDLIAGRTWRKGTKYATAGTNTTTILMHRLILGLSDSKQLVDHINGNPLDNRRKNLRVCNYSQNRMNCPPNIKNKSGYKGVSWCKNSSGNNWISLVYKNYKQHYLGHYANPVDAAKAYDKAAKELHGEFAYLNFPGAS